jgi:DNA-directed RNA polymerase specialized sigma24 family protein
MKPPHKGWVYRSKPHSQSDRLKDGLNPHAPKRNDYVNSYIDGSVEANPESALIQKERLELIKMAGRDYPDQCQYLKHFLLRHESGLPLKAIAEMMEVNVTTAANRLERQGRFLEWYINEHE